MTGPITVGQKWRRKSDGVVVTIVNYHSDWDDAYWESKVGTVTRRGKVFGRNLLRLYEPACESADNE